MSSNIDTLYCFHPAGQGIFASGLIRAKHVRPFRWVFDCGSTAPVTVLKSAVRHYRASVDGDHLHLLCISHFDNDHVSGLGDLLKDLNIDTVVMPYWSPIERLVAVTTDANTDPDYIQFLGNPVAFIIDRARSVREIVVVAGPEGPPSPEGPTDSPPPEDRGSDRINPERGTVSEWRSEFSRETESNNWWAEPMTLRFAAAHNVALRTMEVSTGLEVSTDSESSWEFLFFHKPIDTASARSIRTKIGELVADGQLSLFHDIAHILENSYYRSAIREVYNSNLPSGESINTASLCVYAGPQGDWPTEAALSGPFPFPKTTVHIWKGQTSQLSILYSGDADFKKAENRTELIEFLTSVRLSRIAILQVPHHGSRNNWEIGSAAGFSHGFSVFCAGGTHGHPHGEVIGDLLQHHPILVNQTNGYFWVVDCTPP